MLLTLNNNEDTQNILLKGFPEGQSHLRQLKDTEKGFDYILCDTISGISDFGLVHKEVRLEN